MRRFFVKKEIDVRGFEWSPQTFLFCPYCFEKNSFYSQLPENECKRCHKKMPFPSAMVKDQEKRVEYHVQADSTGDP